MSQMLGAFDTLGYYNPEMGRLIEGAGTGMDEASQPITTAPPDLPLDVNMPAWDGKKTISYTSRRNEDTLALDVKPK